MNPRIKIAITGAVGFIGSHMIRHFLDIGFDVVCAIDSFSPAYDSRWCDLRKQYLIPEVNVINLNLCETSPEYISKILNEATFVVHLAAFAGVRQGEENVEPYLINNVISTSNILKAVKLSNTVKTVFFASSSSIYGDLGLRGPCAEDQADGSHLKSNYALTKWINEVQAINFSKLQQVNTVALRFFTVFGEWGRPDMAYFKFCEMIKNNLPITIYGENGGLRNMTYIGDVTKMVSEMILAFNSLPNQNGDRYHTFNIATGKPISALNMAQIISNEMNIPLKFINMQRPLVDAESTYADISKLKNLIGDFQGTSIEFNLKKYVDWYSKSNLLF
jgi:UDP-glucuronate 4-epimerase